MGRPHALDEQGKAVLLVHIVYPPNAGCRVVLLVFGINGALLLETLRAFAAQLG